MILLARSSGGIVGELRQTNPFMATKRLQRGIGAVTESAVEIMDRANRVQIGNLATDLSNQALASGTIVHPELALRHNLQITRLGDARVSLVKSPLENIPLPVLEKLIVYLKADLVQQIKIGDDTTKFAAQVAKLSLFQKDDADVKLLSDIARRTDVDTRSRWVAALIHDSRGGNSPLLHLSVSEATVSAPKTIAASDTEDFTYKGVARVSISAINLPGLAPITRSITIKNGDLKQAKLEARRFYENLPYTIVDNDYFLDV